MLFLDFVDDITIKKKYSFIGLENKYSFLKIYRYENAAILIFDLLK